jgi:hypothetical protein
MPVLNAAFAAAAMRWLMLLVIIGVAVWALFHLYRRLSSSGTDDLAKHAGQL